eukprot:467349-Lingulodinium_polyedra.AAC.1
MGHFVSLPAACARQARWWDDCQADTARRQHGLLGGLRRSAGAEASPPDEAEELGEGAPTLA